MHIFRAGTHTTAQGRKVKFTGGEVAEIASSYSPQKFHAPIVVGHPRLNDPAYGWVHSLSSSGIDLYADPEDVDPAFAQMMRDGRFRKISIELFAKTAKDNPTPGKYYLRHVGVLGAAAPSVKGLRPVQFAEAEADDVLLLEFAMPDTDHLVARIAQQVSRITRHLREGIIADAGMESANDVLPGWEVDSAAKTAADASHKAYDSYSENPDDPMFTGKTKKGAKAHADDPPQNPPAEPQDAPDEGDENASFSEERAALEERIAALEARDREQNLAAHASFADRMIEKGHVLPRQRDSVIQIMAAIAPAEEKVSFAEEGSEEQSLTDALEDLLARGAPIVSFAEHTRAAGTPRKKDEKLPTAQDIRRRQKEAEDRGENLSFADAQDQLLEEGQAASNKAA